MRPAGPDPVSVLMSMPRSAAIFRARGEILIRSPLAEADAGILADLAAAIAGAGALEIAVAGELEEGEAAVRESPSRIAKTPPIRAFSPSLIKISVNIPSSNASISMVALSVSISARMSPISTVSPICLCHLTRVPSVMVSESLGISMFTDMILLGRRRAERMRNRWSKSSLFRERMRYEKARGVSVSSALRNDSN